MADVVEWTPEGLAALANEHTHGVPSHRDDDRGSLRAKVDASLARYAPCWDRGLAKNDSEGRPRADEHGRAAVAHAKTWIGATPTKLSIVDAAGVLSLVGARGDGHATQLAELLLRDHGIAFMVRVLVQMWSMATNYHDPDWPKSEENLAIWLFGVSDTGSDPSWVNDSSVSHAKGTLAGYLAKRASSDAERAELLAAVDVAWADAPLFARPALAVAADDRDLAERAAREIFAATPPWYPHYARHNLPNLIGDRALLDRLGFIEDARPRLRFLESMGIAALPIYEAMYTSKISKYQREHLTKQLVNIRGPRTATLLAPYAEKAPFAAEIRAYFARAPELLVIVRADKKLGPYYAQLDKLAAKIAPKGTKGETAATKTPKGEKSASSPKTPKGEKSASSPKTPKGEKSASSTNREKSASSTNRETSASSTNRETSAKSATKTAPATKTPAAKTTSSATAKKR